MNPHSRAWQKFLSVFICACLSPVPLLPAEHHGLVKFGGLPVPGVTVSAKQGDKTVTAVTDQAGAYIFSDLPDGTWNLRVEMPGFEPIEREVAVAPGAPSPEWELKMLPFDDIKITAVQPAAPAAAPGAKPPTSPKAAAKAQPPANTQTAFQRADLNAKGAAPAPAPQASGSGDSQQDTDELRQRASDGLLINGASNNGASSPFAQAAAFGNNRRGARSLYNGNFGVTVDNSALDARSFSLTGQDTLKPSYNRITGMGSFGGPIKIPHLVRNGPNFFVAYQWTRNRTATTTPGLVPTPDQRSGEAYGLAPGQISPQAAALLALYPLPNFAGGQYNYQVPLVAATHQDSLQTRLNKTIGRRNMLAGAFGLQSTRTDNPNLFGFLDTGSTLGLTSNANWRHTFGQRLFGTLGIQFSRLAARVTPYYANRVNVSGNQPGGAGIQGNDQQPINWGPPNLTFVSGITPLSDAQASFNRNQTSAISYDMLWNRGRHNVSFGGDFKRQEFNYFSQENPRGSFAFTGLGGADFQSFLLGVPDTISIAFGNADKYFRASAYDAYITDDWRVSPAFTLNAGVRWEYGSPITELYGRLVNLQIGPNFTTATPVCAINVAGCTLLASQAGLPDSLVHPDRHAFQPRIGFSWRPFPASSMVVRGGYGVYYNTSAYQNIAIQMAQQFPLSNSFTQQNLLGCHMDTAFVRNSSGQFNCLSGSTPQTFALDPNFRIGYAQTWSLTVQRDLPGALVGILNYLGTKGTRGMQEFLPNTYPFGAVSPCPDCPSGFIYLTSNGNSTRESLQVQLRRRLHNGFTANLQYTFAKAIDDSALGGRGQGGSLIAQNWLDLSAERGLSTFDQRHQLTFQAQYTTGMGVGGGTLLNGWKGTLLKEWTFVTSITAGSGFPLTPTYLAPVRGTGVTGPQRPDYTGAPLYSAAGRFLNPAAYVAPPPGQWGNAGRDSITGPAQFLFNASMGRTFRMGDRINTDLRIDAVNALNHVTFPSWNTTLGNAQFGLPMIANQMRTVQTTLRVRF